MRRLRNAALAAVLALIAASCGSRIVPLEDGRAVGTDIPGVTTGTAGTVTGGPAGTTTGGPATTGTTTSTTTGTTSGGGLVPNCVATRGTDTGVTKDKIRLGLVASLTGPLPGQFNSAVEATDSYFRAVNDAGGICGRKIELLIRDDNGNQNIDYAAAKSLAVEHKVFAFVGSVAAPHDEGIGKVSREYKIPDIGFPLSWERTGSPYTYGVPGQLNKQTIGVGASGSMYLNKANNIKRVALFWLNESEVSILNAWAFEASMKKATNNAIEICHEQAAGVLDNNYLNYVVAMQGNCGDPSEVAVYSTMENNANIKLAQAMADQGFEPKVFAPTFTSYLPSFISEAGGATEGAYIAMPQVPIERLQRPQSEWTPGTRELATYMSVLKRYYPRHKPPGSFGGPGWGMAALFTEAAKRCGAALTRKCIFEKLDTMGPFSANGFLSPVAPSAHHIYTADLIVQVRNGKFVEIDPPAGATGPPGAVDFWDRSTLHNWQQYICSNPSEFPNMAQKRSYLDRC